MKKEQPTSFVDIFLMTVALILMTLSTSANAKSVLDCDQIRADEKVCLACNLYFEARGEQETGIIAVALVTLNRVKSLEYPNSICEVVWQKWQFSWTNDGKPDQVYSPKLWIVILKITGLMMDKKVVVEVPNISDDVLWYHRYDIERRWSKKLKVAARIGGHMFFKRDHEN